MAHDAAKPSAREVDHEGLICAFQLSPLTALGPQALTTASSRLPQWLHFNAVDLRSRRWIEHRTELPEQARSLLVALNPRIQLQVLTTPSGGVALLAVLGDLHHDARLDLEHFGVVHVYADEARIITTRRHALQSPDTLRRELMAGGLDVPTPFVLLENLIRCMAETFGSTISKLSDQTDDAEDLILAGRYKDQGATLGGVRRVLVRLRRQLTANRVALATLPARLPESVPADHQQRLRQAIERLDTVAQDLELVLERARLLQEEIAGQVNESTNRNLFWLSTMTTTLLPITLITGVFGMNVGGLPFTNDHRGFWWVMGVMSVALTAILVLLRRRNVL